jgi:mannose-6-phosphate isomerase-like protein (cupin superfamily)
MSSSNWMFSLQDAKASLPAAPELIRFHYGFRHGTMKVGVYSPVGNDPQGPHHQDEIYIIISGTGEFVKRDERRAFAPQDVIFVEAGAEHRFENFSDDFSTWVVFWGPKGGEG